MLAVEPKIYDDEKTSVYIQISDEQN